MKQLIFCLLILLHTGITAQDLQVSIKVLNNNGTPLEGATAALHRASDSVLVKTSITDNLGIAEFKRVAAGTYRVRITAIQYDPHYTAAFTVRETDVRMAAVTLSVAAATNLQEVTVSARKPFIQKLSDRIVVNVESSIVSAGSSALDVMERSPGITVDQNDQISLRGRSGVIIMIDGKRSALSGADLANYLRGLPSQAIERIEIITNPSAKYDAAGNSGIIDIRMKKDQRLGFNGTVNAGYGQGIYPKANAGTTLNFRNKKLNVFGNYNYAYRENLNNLILDRNFFTNGVFNGQDKKDNYSVMPVGSHTERFGADYFPSRKTIIGFVVNSNFLHFRRTNNNRSLVIDKHHNPTFTFGTLGTNNDHNDNHVGNINFKHTFDSTETTSSMETRMDI
jgi:hypothetical protein